MTRNNKTRPSTSRSLPPTVVGRVQICVGLGAVAVAAIVLWAVFVRGGQPTVESRRPAKKVVAGSVETAAEPRTLREAAQALPAVETSVDRDAIRALVREAGAAYKVRDAARFNEAFGKLLKHGASIQRVLAEILLEVTDAEERLVAALALQQVATAEIGPFAVALVRSELPDEIKSIAIDLLTKFKVAEAAPILEKLLFESGTAADLRRRAIGYFIETAGAEVLARAAVEPTFGELRTVAAEGLAKIGTAEAATLLMSAWKKTFVPKSGEALANYYLLQALASMDAKLLRSLVKDFLKTETNTSARNVFLSMLGRADRALAFETIREILANRDEKVSVRQQALMVLAALGGAEAQEILIDTLAAGGHPKEILESANALLQQDKLEIAFDKVRRLFGSTQDPMLRAVMAGLLAKYGDQLASDANLVAMLQREAELGMGNADPAVRGLSIQLSAQLAQYGSDPATSLINLYGTLSDNEKSALPTVFSELTKRNDDPRVRLLLEQTLSSETAAEHTRLMAADALMASGGSEQVYGAIETSKNADSTALLVGVALARGGDDAASRLQKVAATTEDPAKKQAILDQLKAWSASK